MFTLLPGFCAALPCACGGSVIIHPRQLQNISLGLNLTFGLVQFLTPCSHSCPREQLPERVNDFTGLWRRKWEAHSGSNTFLKSLHTQVQPLEHCSQQRPLLTSAWGAQRKEALQKVLSIFPYFPAHTHKLRPHSLFGVLSQSRCDCKQDSISLRGWAAGKAAADGCRTCWCLLLWLSELLPPPLPKLAQGVSSSVPALSSLPCST